MLRFLLAKNMPGELIVILMKKNQDFTDEKQGSEGENSEREGDTEGREDTRGGTLATSRILCSEIF